MGLQEEGTEDRSTAGRAERRKQEHQHQQCAAPLGAGTGSARAPPAPGGLLAGALARPPEALQPSRPEPRRLCAGRAGLLLVGGEAPRFPEL